jgi:hypothetical protein
MDWGWDTVRFAHAGPCVIYAQQEGDGDHSPAFAQQMVTVLRTPQTVSFTSTPTGTVLGTTYTPTGSGGGSGNPVTFSADASTTNAACTVAGSVVSFTHAGECVLNADQAAGMDYGAAATVQQTITLDKVASDSSLTIEPTTITAGVVSRAPGSVIPTGVVTFSVADEEVGSAPLVDGVATLAYVVPSGATRHVDASYAGDGDFTGSSASVDRSDPSITARLTSNPAPTPFGWYRSTVTVAFTCTPAGAPLVRACPGRFRMMTERAAQKFTRTIHATDGGAATVAVTGINIDLTKPRVWIANVPDHEDPSDTSRPRCVGRDALSGIATCKLTRRTLRGVTWYTVRATDRAGNFATKSGLYRGTR